MTYDPPLLRRVLSFEQGIWRSLYRWITRRPLTREADETAFGYGAAKAPVVWAFIAVNMIEIAAVHLILPWTVARSIVDILGGYSLVWMFGVLASVRVYPHLVGDAGLRIRNGFMVDMTIAWDAIATIRTRTRPLRTSRTITFDRTTSGTVLRIGVMSQTNVEVTLREPMSVPLPEGDSEPVTALHIHADDAKGLAARAADRLNAAVVRVADIDPAG